MPTPGFGSQSNTARRLALHNFTATSFAGISKTSPIIIAFPEGHHFIQASGDQGTRKTSMMECLKALLGENMVANAINSIDKDRRASIEFTGIDGKLYRAKFTKTTFTLENIVTDEEGNIETDDKGKERTREEKQPTALVRKLVGPLGIDPMTLKLMNASDQIDWFKRFAAAGAEQVKGQETKIKKEYKEAYDKRTAANKQIRSLTTLLEKNDYYINRSAWEEKFKKIDEEADVKKKIEEKAESADKITRAETKIGSLRETEERTAIEITALEQEILRLLAARKQKRIELAVTKTAIATGEQFLEENASVRDEYKELNQKLTDINELKVQKVSFDHTVKNAADLQLQKDAVKEFIAQMEKAEGELAELIKSYVPDIPDFELVAMEKDETPAAESYEPIDGVEQPEKKEIGLYWKGMNIYQLCESELYELVLQIWAAFNVQIVFVENIYNLGTNAIERLNWFVEQGGYVFATQMDREEKNIVFKIDTSIK